MTTEKSTALVSIMKAKGMTQKDLAQKMGVTRQAVALWQRTGRFSSATLPKVAEALEVSVSDLIGESEEDQQGKRLVKVVADSPVPPGYIRVPVYDVCGSCGTGCINDVDIVKGSIDMALWFAHSLPGVTAINRLQIVSSSGDSMTPTIESRSMLIVDTAQTSVSADGIYCLRVEDELFIKRIQRNLDGTITLISDNPHYLPKTVNRADLDNSSIIGRVVYAFNGRHI